MINISVFLLRFKKIKNKRMILELYLQFSYFYAEFLKRNFMKNAEFYQSIYLQY